MRLHVKQVALTSALSTLVLGLAPLAHSGVNVTPASVSGYEFFPPEFGSGGSGTGGDRGEAMLNCIRFIDQGDQTFNLLARDFYTLEAIRVYYQMYGGDGGTSSNGGGGGSSAILQNGSAVVVAPGGDGGLKASIRKGEFWVKPNDIIRIVTGGGGGAGQVGHSGGGGGAGWRGGGAGGAYTPGKGGSTINGAGGTGTMPGTSGSGFNGGVSTYPDGNSSPGGPSSDNSYGFFVTSSGYMMDQYRHPATPTGSGSGARPWAGSQIITDGMFTSGGYGGAFGWGGSPTITAHYDLSFGGAWGFQGFKDYVYFTIGRNSIAGSVNTDKKYISGLSDRTPLDPRSFKINRAPMVWQKTINGAAYTYSEEGALPGQVILKYSAPDCNLLPK